MAQPLKHPQSESVPSYGVAAVLGTPTLRPGRGFLAHCVAPMDLWECIRGNEWVCALPDDSD